MPQQGNCNQGLEISHSLQRNKKARIFVLPLCLKLLLYPALPQRESCISRAMAVL